MKNKNLPTINECIAYMNSGGYGVRRGYSCYIVYFLNDESKRFPDGGDVKAFSLNELRHAAKYGW